MLGLVLGLVGWPAAVIGLFSGFVLGTAVLVPLHDPLRLAEDIAVLDLASNGRITVIGGLGYRPEEYEARMKIGVAAMRGTSRCSGYSSRRGRFGSVSRNRAWAPALLAIRCQGVSRAGDVSQSRRSS